MKQLQVVKPQDIDAKTFENLVIKGDLGGLTEAQRVQYYGTVCQTLGLNPLTKPFAYILLNGKLTLYALKDCTEQLRNLHNISVTIAARESTDGVYVVTARATRPDGRQDESVGAVPIDKVQGEARANAMMKAETKAKRRVTLSICGLGILDESEVDSITSDAPKWPDEVKVEYPKALTKAEVQAKKDAGQLKGQQVFARNVPAELLEDKPVVDEEAPAIFGEPDPKAGAAWQEHKSFMQTLDEVPKQVAEKIAAEDKPKDSMSMFHGTCEAPGCTSVLTKAKSESEKYPGREYITCFYALQERAKMRKSKEYVEGKLTEKEINSKFSHHTREWV